jgi:hypothetical protein
MAGLIERVPLANANIVDGNRLPPRPYYQHRAGSRPYSTGEQLRIKAEYGQF